MYLKRIEHLKSKVHYLKSCLTLINMFYYLKSIRDNQPSLQRYITLRRQIIYSKTRQCPPVFEDPPVFENLPLFVDSPALFEDLLVFKDSAVFEYSRVFEDAGALVVEDLPQFDGPPRAGLWLSLSQSDVCLCSFAATISPITASSQAQLSHSSVGRLRIPHPQFSVDFGASLCVKITFSRLFAFGDYLFSRRSAGHVVIMRQTLFEGLKGGDVVRSRSCHCRRGK